jgi:hypothetical protein
MSNATIDLAWWSPQEVPLGQTLNCRIGPLTLDVHHAHGEWHLAVTQDEDVVTASKASLTLRAGGIAAEDLERYIVARPGTRLRLLPLLADRPVVIRPRQPVFLPSGEEVTLYMSSPATVRVEVGDPPVLLREVATLPLSDTWFGPSTREGELCYSGRTHARHSLAEVPRRAHRVITPVRIRNDVETPLPLDKFSLPVPVLSVYGAADGSLWTQGVSLIRTSASDMATLRIDQSPPHYAGRADLVSGPREPHARGGLVRAFSMLFGNGA